jgi:hypothetical protein
MLATSPIHPNRHPHPIHHPPRDPLLQAFFANPEASAVTSDTARLQDMPPQAQNAISAYLDNPGDADAAPEWTEEDVVHLHWRLLLELRRLPDPETPLEEKLDTLAWGPSRTRASTVGPSRSRAACASSAPARCRPRPTSA